MVDLSALWRGTVEVDWTDSSAYGHAASDVSEDLGGLRYRWGTKVRANPARPILEPGSGSLRLIGADYAPDISTVLSPRQLRSRHRCRITPPHGRPILCWIIFAGRAATAEVSVTFNLEGLGASELSTGLDIEQPTDNADTTQAAFREWVATQAGVAAGDLEWHLLTDRTFHRFAFEGPRGEFISRLAASVAAQPCATRRGGLRIHDPASAPTTEADAIEWDGGALLWGTDRIEWGVSSEICIPVPVVEMARSRLDTEHIRNQITSTVQVGGDTPVALEVVDSLSVEEWGPWDLELPDWQRYATVDEARAALAASVAAVSQPRRQHTVGFALPQVTDDCTAAVANLEPGDFRHYAVSDERQEIDIDAECMIYACELYVSRSGQGQMRTIITEFPAREWGTGFALPAAATDPQGVDIDGDGDILLLDAATDRIYRRQAKTWDAGIALPAAATQPTDLAIIPNGLAVLDAATDRIYRRMPAGAPVWDVLPGGTGGIALPSPSARVGGLSVDAAGRILALDYNLNVVRRWDGSAWTTVTALPTGNGSGIASDADGRIIVAANNPGRVYTLVGSEWSSGVPYPSAVVPSTVEGLAIDRAGQWLLLSRVPRRYFVRADMMWDDGTDIPIATSFGAIAVRSDGALAVLARGTGDIYVRHDGVWSAAISGPAVSGPAGSGFFGLAFRSNGDYLVAFTRANGTPRVYTGTVSPQWDAGLTLPAAATSPQGVAADSAGDLLVVDAATSKVYRYSAGAWDAGTDLPAAVTAPRGLAVNDAGDWLVVDAATDRVYTRSGGAWGAAVVAPPAAAQVRLEWRTNPNNFLFTSAEWALLAGSTSGSAIPAPNYDQSVVSFLGIWVATTASVTGITVDGAALPVTAGEARTIGGVAGTFYRSQNTLTPADYVGDNLVVALGATSSGGGGSVVALPAAATEPRGVATDDVGNVVVVDHTTLSYYALTR